MAASTAAASLTSSGWQQRNPRPGFGYLGFQGNRDLFMNMVSWLGSEEDMISVRPKPSESQHLDVTASQMSKLLFLGVLGVPPSIIAVGATVWWGRR